MRRAALLAALLLAGSPGVAGAECPGEARVPLFADLDEIARHATRNHLELVVGDDAALERALAMIRSAQEVIRFETFLLNGRHGEAIVDALIERHRAGVRVEVLLDPNALRRRGVIASVLNFEDRNGPLKERLEDAGIDVRRFEKRLMPAMRWGVRAEHAKLLVVDDRIAMFGGTNFDDEENHDYDFVVRGPGVHAFVHHFREVYRGSGGNPMPPHASREPAPPPNGTLRILSTGPGERTPKDELVRAIREARESVDVEMYGFTDGDLMDELLAARRRLGPGRVRVILYDNVFVPAPFAMLASDYPSFDAMSRLSSGEAPVDVRILKSPPNGKMHTKALIVDRRTAYVGSANYTPQELRGVHNYVGVVEGDEPLRAITDAFDGDWSRASDKKIRRWREYADRHPEVTAP